MSTILEQIFDAKRRRIYLAKAAAPPERIACEARKVRGNSVPHRFRQGLENRSKVNVIAEFKKASPSKGVINGDADPVAIARSCERAGAAAISVLTEEDFFQGSLDDLRAIRDAVSLPILCKDFVLDEYQIYEAAAAGADAILLIVAAPPVDRLRRLRHVAEQELGMDALVEVHTEEEMRVAIDVGATLVGVNNRDLRSFKVSLEVSRMLAGCAPNGAILIAESGLRTREDLEELSRLGYSGFLIGETLMRSNDPEGQLKKLVGEQQR